MSRKLISLDRTNMIKKIKSICRNKILNIVKEANKDIQSNVKQTRLFCESISSSFVEVKNQIESISSSFVEAKNQIESISSSFVEIKNQIERNRLILERAIYSLNFLQEFSGEIVSNMYSVFSYCTNQTICNQIDITNTDIYKYYKSLHNLTSWHKILDDNIKKKRVGRAYDGGYIMIEPFSSTKIAYSFGINDDVSWDKDMANNGYQVYQYDHTIESLPENHPNFHWEKIGLTGLNETDKLKKLDTLLTKNGHENTNGMLLKMDVEGAEWNFFNFCDQQTLDKFDQIVVELHDLNDFKNSEQKLSGLKKLTNNHIVVHIHGNNHSRVDFCGDIITPNVLELTLVKKDKFPENTINDIFLERIDMANRSNTPDILIGKW